MPFFCTACGREYNHSNPFCQFCGAHIEQGHSEENEDSGEYYGNENNQDDYDNDDYDEEEESGFERDLVFLIMPFFGGDNQTVFLPIKDECSKLGLNAVRVDENVGSGLIIQETTEFINRAEFIICDLTRERPNVYYELGYAHGKGNDAKNIFIIARFGTQIHFDLNAYRIRFYHSTKQLRLLISSVFAEMVQTRREQYDEEYCDDEYDNEGYDN